jgi:tight adherence protein C
VQEPLKQFSERIREQRKLDMKEKVGKLTVKMTGVMVMTLLPGLLVITGGIGFLAVIRAISKMGASL